MTDGTGSMLNGELLDDVAELTLAELCRACEVSADTVLMLVEEGVIEPRGAGVSGWRFRSFSIRRVRCAVHLERDLGVNAAGAALAVELLEELDALRKQVRRLDAWNTESSRRKP